jgi:hypothetical protein
LLSMAKSSLSVPMNSRRARAARDSRRLGDGAARRSAR